MEKLHKLIQTLQASPQKVKLLQEINSQLLSRFRLKITEGIFLYPLEVEAYYNDGDQFEDSSCHCHALQYDRFGKLYEFRFVCRFLDNMRFNDICRQVTFRITEILRIVYTYIIICGILQLVL